MFVLYNDVLNNKDKKELIILNIKKENSDTYGKLSEKDKKRIKELEKKDKDPQRTDSFWCSALVGCIYTKSKILEINTDWSIMEPCDFSKEQQNLNLINNASLGEEIKIL